MSLSNTLRLTAQQLHAALRCGLRPTEQDLADLVQMLEAAGECAANLEAGRQRVPNVLPENVVAFRPQSLRAAMRRLEANHGAA